MSNAQMLTMGAPDVDFHIPSTVKGGIKGNRMILVTLVGPPESPMRHNLWHYRAAPGKSLNVRVSV